jgi:SAM-dependent methyltransferase
MLRALGWIDLVGIDLVPDAVASARARGFDVRCGEAEEQLAALPDASVDVVIASMVLEHLPSPFAVIDAISRILKPGGEFLFSTVVRDSWDAAQYSDYWAGYDFPRHLVFFSRSDLRRALEGRFDQLEEFGQNAPIDFVRSATWRTPEGRFADRLITSAPGPALRALGAWVVRNGRSTRVSFRCVCSRRSRKESRA